MLTYTEKAERDGVGSAGVHVGTETQDRIAYLLLHGYAEEQSGEHGMLTEPPQTTQVKRGSRWMTKKSK